MGWGQALGGVLVALVLLYLPGTVVAHRLGLGWLTAAFFAPGISVVALIGAGILTRLLGAGFTIVWGGLSLAAVTAVMSGVGSRATRGRTLTFGLRPALPSLLVFSALAMVIATVVVVRGVPSPTDIAWLPDNSFHLGTVEWMRRNASASLLDVNNYVRLDAPLTYPGGFHVVAAAVSIWSGLPTTAAIHVVLIVACGTLWPASVGLLGVQTWGRYAAATPLLAVLLADMPFLFFTWGPLWPYAFAICLLPVAVVLTRFALVGLSEEGGRPSAPTVLILGAWLVACLAVHPSVFVWWLAITLIMIPLTVTHPRLAARPLARLVFGVGLNVAFWGVIALSVPQSMRPTNYTQLEAPLKAAVMAGMAVLRNPLAVVALWLVLTLWGVLLAVRRQDSRWVAATWFFMLCLYCARVRFPNSWSRSVAWPWWDDPQRIEAVLALLAVLATGGVLAAVASDAVKALDGRLPRLVGVVAQLPGILLGVLMLGSVGSNTAALSGVYGPHYEPADRPLLPRAALEALAASLPADAVVAANPRRGSVYLYALGGPRLVYPTWGSPITPDLETIGSRLPELMTDAAVCSAAHRQGITHVIVGGPLDGLTIPRRADYSGVDRVPTSFRLVSEAAPYSAYALPECVESVSARGGGS